MPKSRLYSPRLDASLISPLYHAARTQQIPMTRLASRFVQEGLEREFKKSDSSIIREEPPVSDPHRRK